MLLIFSCLSECERHYIKCYIQDAEQNGLPGNKTYTMVILFAEIGVFFLLFFPFFDQNMIQLKKNCNNLLFVWNSAKVSNGTLLQL